MRKACRWILPLLLIISLLCGCAAGKDEALVEGYLSSAQALIDAGEYEAAIRVLEEGIEKTDHAELKVLLVDTQTLLEKTEPTETDAPSSTEASTAQDEIEPSAIPEEPLEPPEYFAYDLNWDDSDTAAIEDLYNHSIFYDGSSTIVGQATVDRTWEDVSWYWSSYQGDRYLMVMYSLYSEDGPSEYWVVFREIDADYAEVIEFWRNSVLMDDSKTQAYLNEWERCWSYGQGGTQNTYYDLSRLAPVGTYSGKYTHYELYIFSITGTEIVFQCSWVANGGFDYANSGVIYGTVDYENRSAQGYFEEDGNGHSGQIYMDFTSLDYLGYITLTCTYTEEDTENFGLAVNAIGLFPQ